MSFTYAIGDIHGSLDKLKSLVEACRQYAGNRPAKFVFLGDYIDRGPDSAGVLRYMMSLQRELKEQLIPLKGNHEALALEVANDANSGLTWLVNGGHETLESYGVAHARELPRAHLDWLSALRVTYDDGRRLFVHAGVDPRKPLDAQDEADLLWIREPFLSDRRDYGRLIVHGHTPVRSGKPELRANRLNLDTAAVFGGPLTAAVFDDAQTKPLAYIKAQ